MQRLGRYAGNFLLFRKTQPIRFFGTQTSPHLNDTLHRWIMATKERRLWRVKVTPVLDEWVKQGRKINPTDLRGVINALCESQRFTHALQVSEWITQRRVFDPSPEDYSARLYLVEIQSGLTEVEKFFKSIPENMKEDSVYTTLLSLYTKSKETRHEAEAIYQKMRELNLLTKPNPYYLMISLYGLLGERNMVDEISRQMKENGVEHDRILTANNVLSAYASIPDNVEAMEKFLNGIEGEDPRFVLAKQTGKIMAKAYLKAGSSYKAIEILKRTELADDGKLRESVDKLLMEMHADEKQDDAPLHKLIHTNGRKRKILRAYGSKGGGEGGSYLLPGYYYYGGCGDGYSYGGGGSDGGEAGGDDGGGEAGGGGDGGSGGGGGGCGSAGAGAGDGGSAGGGGGSGGGCGGGGGSGGCSGGGD
ncbi:unnamed protein product [Microthlaspi erraticum]|uniref:Pentacotripeptide-repeat region of PRORP domain-containing protein n=1 Tax=Microthlaspi erraticum TaxID=1685480 RepID=A0A6D2JRP0_9BRAS|nr:unnamed protein product [Microthlaspi erraticum]CAA7042475.1 unnamed protein product [Microthlaspi erraticum]